MGTAARVRVRRAYEEPAGTDGTRVLVDRLWPRGLSRARASLDEWCKQVAPSTQLRTWYGHDPERFDEFGRRYRRELQEPGRADALVTHNVRDFEPAIRLFGLRVLLPRDALNERAK